MGQAFINEIDGKYFSDNVPIGELNRIHIVPSVCLEWVVNDGITQHEVHLAFGHAGL